MVGQPSDGQVTLVTGLAGAGRTSALRALEDFGYEAVDNLPLSLMPHLLAGLQSAQEKESRRSLALGIDSRSQGFRPETLLEQIEELHRASDWKLRILYLDCSDEMLIRRFTETRRRHPLAPDRPIADGIAEERQLMIPIRAAADMAIDTTGMSPADLKRQIRQAFLPSGTLPLAVTVMSFSYRLGLPREADMVIDVRFLRNPHYVPELQPETGEAASVQDFVAADPAYSEFFSALVDLIGPRLPDFQREGKSYLTIAIGCTGGRHRSVAVADKLCQWMRHEGIAVNLRHRDLT